VTGSAGAALFGPDDEGKLTDHVLTDAVAVEAELVARERTENTNVELVRVDGDPGVTLGANGRGLQLVPRLEDGLEALLGLVAARAG
jgi:hypothetical protein